MNSERSVLKYMEFFANKAIEGKGITDIATGDVIKDEKKFNENYTNYNAMMAGYFMCSKEYHNQVIEQKNQWLDIHFPLLKKRIYKKYGNNKNLKNSVNAILIDDNETIRNTFKGIAFNPIDLWG